MKKLKSKLKKPAKKAAKKSIKKAAKKTVKKSKKSAKKAVRKAVSVKPKGPKPIGLVTHFYGHISVAIVKFSQSVAKGAMLHFKGATTDFVQVVDSMQYDHQPIDVAKKGQEVGMQVKEKVRDGDEVYSAE